MLPASRAEAKAAGSLAYFTGRPCKNGHLTPRVTHNGHCKGCKKERDAGAAQVSILPMAELIEQNMAKYGGLNKYRNQPTVVEGERFASKAEAKRHQELLLLQKAGIIRDLKRQPRYPLTVKGVRIGEYRADWSYEENGRMIAEDKKGMRTQLFDWKAKHFRAEYQNIELRLT